MTLDEYQAGMRETRMYPGNMKLVYPSLGLCGEAGESVEIIKKMVRRGEKSLNPDKTEKLKGELGDVMYYLAALADDAGLTLEEIAAFNQNKLKKRKEEGQIKREGS